MKIVFVGGCVMMAVSLAHAATMCVPDLTECTSCEPVGYAGPTWHADCCGVRVSGIALGLNADVGQYVSLALDYTSDDVDFGGNWAIVCIMTEPVRSPYAYVASVCSENYYEPVKAGQSCSLRFKPKVAFQVTTATLFCMD